MIRNDTRCSTSTNGMITRNPGFRSPSTGHRTRPSTHMPPVRLIGTSRRASGAVNLKFTRKNDE